MAQIQRAVEESERLMEEAGKRARGRIGRKENGESKGKQPYRCSLKTQDNSGRYDDSKHFAQQAQDGMDGKIPERDTLLLGKTPELYREIGLSNPPVTMDQTHGDDAMKGTKCGSSTGGAAAATMGGPGGQH